MPNMEIEVSSQHSVIAGQTVYRPVTINQGSWKKFWTVAKELDEKGILTIETKLEEVLKENIILNELVSEMRERLRAHGEV